MIACCVAIFAAAAAADVLVDPDVVSHRFDGMGAQIWSGDMSVQPLLANLNMAFVRMELGPNWSTLGTPPTDGTRASFDAYVAQHYGSSRLQNMQNSMAMLNALGIEAVFNQFHVPSSWRWPILGTLRSANYQDFALLWGAMLVYLDAAGVRPEYVELFNEPDGTWNCRVSPEGYNQIVPMVRAELDARGFSDVQIVGPGLAYLDHGSGGANYIHALDPNTVASLGAFSTHAWDEQLSQGCGPEFIRQRWAPFGNAMAAKDPYFEKPIFVTEYMTGNRRFHGVSYPAPGDNYAYSASDTRPFAVRVFENTLSMLNLGASVPFLWEAADQSWSDNGWGLQRRSADGSAKRPSYYAVKVLTDSVPAGSDIIDLGPQNDNEIYLSAFRNGSTVVVAAANGTASTQSKSVVFSGVDDFEVVLALSYSDQGTGTAAGMYSVEPGSRIALTMPSDSVLAITIDFEPGVIEKVLEWKFEGNLNDTSGYGNHASTATGGFDFTRGRFGQAVAFDGTEVLIELADGVELPLAGDDDWSMTLWVYTDLNISSGGNYHALALAAMGSNSWAKNGNARSIGNWGWGSGVSFYSTTMRPTSTGTAYDTGRWQLITITYEHSLWQEQGTDTTGEALKIYKDGTLVGSFNPQGRYYAGGFHTADNIVSLLPTIPDQGPQRFVGKFDEFAIWRGVLSPVQIYAMVAQMPIVGDLNGDRMVDFADVAVFFEFWLSEDEHCVANLDGNQIVNYVDFAVLARKFLQ